MHQKLSETFFHIKTTYNKYTHNLFQFFSAYNYLFKLLYLYYNTCSELLKFCP